jgi:heat-inducible transcriptional repressor
MQSDRTAPLTERQREILARVIEEFVATGQPVGSKYLVEQSSLGVSPSTVRNELAELEARGLLTHPHTSAGRVPTEGGYRLYADELLARQEPRPGAFPLDYSAVRREIDAALEATSEVLSRATHLLALVSAPPLETTIVRHVEVLLLQPHVVMVVVITSTGGVTKRLVTFEQPIDVGLADWAGQYLNETVAGLRLGARLLRSRFEDPALSERERAFLERLRPAFTDVLEAEEQTLYVGGTAGVLDEFRADELLTYRRLLEVLEERAAMLDLLRASLGSKRPFVRVGPDLADSDLAGVALVGAPYGLRHLNLGAVSLLGPTRMDYEKAIAAVRSAAHELSRFVEELYET